MPKMLNLMMILNLKTKCKKNVTKKLLSKNVASFFLNNFLRGALFLKVVYNLFCEKYTIQSRRDGKQLFPSAN